MNARGIGPVGTWVRVGLGLLFLLVSVGSALRAGSDLFGLLPAGVAAFLGVSLLLAARMGLSGCEVTAIPNRLAGGNRHLFCIGGLSHLDRWERARKLRRQT